METDQVSNDVVNSVESSNPAISTTTVEYRTYGAVDDKGAFAGTKKSKEGVVTLEGNPSVLSATATGKNWDNAEKNGATLLNKNEFKFYIISDEAALPSLVADAAQRLYIIQKGLDAIQTAAANRLQTDLVEKKDKSEADAYMYNDDTIDLREAINRPPEKKNLSPEEKFSRAVSTIAPDVLAKLLADLQAKMGQASA
jgi:hypothetical protein